MLSGKVVYATMNRPCVLSGRVPRTVAVPQIPTKPLGQAGVGERPSLHPAAATSPMTATHATRLRMGAIIAPRGRSVTLTRVSAGKNAKPAPPTHEDRGATCHHPSGPHQGIPETGTTRPA